MNQKILTKDDENLYPAINGEQIIVYDNDTYDLAKNGK